MCRRGTSGESEEGMGLFLGTLTSLSTKCQVLIPTPYTDTQSCVVSTTRFLSPLGLEGYLGNLGGRTYNLSLGVSLTLNKRGQLLGKVSDLRKYTLLYTRPDFEVMTPKDRG